MKWGDGGVGRPLRARCGGSGETTSCALRGEIIVTNLQVQPEIWGNLLIFRQSKGGTPSNFWATVEDLINPIDVPYKVR